MADIKQHPILIRKLIDLHKQSIHSAAKQKASNEEICATCFEDTVKPKDARTATSRTLLPPNSR